MLFLLFLIACASKKNHQPGPMVQKIRFEGNGYFDGTSDYNLRSAMSQKQNEAFAWRDPKNRMVAFDKESLRLDSWRIENWYAHKGYFEAKVLGWDIQEANRVFRKIRQVKIIGKVAPGKPSYIRHIQIKRQGKMSKALQDKLNEILTLSPGQIFSMDAVKMQEKVLLERVRNRGFARAKITHQVQVWPTKCERLSGNQENLQSQKLCYRRLLEASCHRASQNKKSLCGVAYTSVEKCGFDMACIEDNLQRYRSWIVGQEGNYVVDIIFFVETGESCQFGEFVFNGNVNVPLRPIIDQIQEGAKLTPGSRYSASSLYTAQEMVQNLGLFSVVNIAPSYEGTDDILPVHITLSESRFKEARVGGGLMVEGGKRGANISADFSHKNVANSMTRLNWKNEFGVTFISNFTESDDDQKDSSFEEAVEEVIDDYFSIYAPTAVSNLSIEVPYLFYTKWTFGLNFQYELGVENFYRFSSPEISPSLRWRLPLNWKNAALSFVFSYHYSYLDYLDTDVDLSYLDDELKEEVAETYSLSALGQSVILEGRDDPLFTRTGIYASLSLLEAGKLLQGTYDYWRVDSDFRYYYPISNIFDFKYKNVSLRNWLMRAGKWRKPPGVIAFRISSGLIFPYWDGNFQETPAPLNELLKLGGGSTVRGWRSDHLGPYACSETPNCYRHGVQISDDILPVGGSASLMASLEYRHYWNAGYGLAAFVDMGRVWELPQDIRLDEINVSVGGGFRYKSSIGPFRLDYARRLPTDTYFAAEPQWMIHLALAESY